ncbi:hypothetical protein AgCh_022816 [Apium graveolens]
MVYVLNRLPIRALSAKTPYEAWTEIKPDISYIHVFGCLLHMKIPNAHVKKLDDRSVQVVNLERDVVFKENKCWSCEQQNKFDATEQPFLSIVDAYETKKDDQLLSETTQEVQADDELMLMGTVEPVSYHQAVKELEWREAMKREINSIEDNGTWKLTELPDGNKVTGLKWIYKLKRDANGNVVKHKAGLVAKGYAQEHAVDYDNIFAPVTRFETIYLLLALAAKNGWEVHHLNVKTTFLNGEISEDIDVAQPDGYVKKGKEKMVYKLLKPFMI